jgi:hypothetical protein
MSSVGMCFKGLSNQTWLHTGNWRLLLTPNVLLHVSLDTRQYLRITMLTDVST